MRLPRILLALAGIGAVAAAAVVLNLLLLGNVAAQNDPVGKLTPRANLPAAPHWTIRPAHGIVEHDGSDD